MNFLFLLDTSASMNQRLFNGLRLIDLAKAGVEYFVNKRKIDALSSSDTYSLVTYEEGLSAVKCYKERSSETFLAELKMQQAFDTTNLTNALKLSFDILNMGRIPSNIDRFGMGRRVWITDPSVIILIAESSEWVESSGLLNELHFPSAPSYPGCDLIQEPYRWDQRLFSVLLHIPSSQEESEGWPEKQFNILSGICEETRGSVRVVRSSKGFLSKLDSILQDCSMNSMFSTMIHFDPISQNAGTRMAPLESCIETLNREGKEQSLLFRPGTKGLWPIPEDYSFVNSGLSSIPVTRCAPTLKFHLTPMSPPFIPKDFPVDAYLLAQSPFVQTILSSTRSGSAFKVCSTIPGDSNAIGYLLPQHEGGGKLILYLLPYNFPTLFSLLNNYQSHTPKWKNDFDQYVASLPHYYVAPLKSALGSFNPPTTHILSGPQVSPSNLVSDTLVASSREPPHPINFMLQSLQSKASDFYKQFLNQIKLQQQQQQQQQLQQSPQSDLLLSMLGMDLMQIHPNALLDFLDECKAIIFPSSNVVDSSPSNSIIDPKHNVPISIMGDYKTYLSKILEKPRPTHEEIINASLTTSMDLEPTVGGRQSFNENFVESPHGRKDKMHNKKRKKISSRAEFAKRFKISDGEVTTISSSSTPITSALNFTMVPSPQLAVTSATSVDSQNDMKMDIDAPPFNSTIQNPTPTSSPSASSSSLISSSLTQSESKPSQAISHPKNVASSVDINKLKILAQWNQANLPQSKQLSSSTDMPPPTPSSSRPSLLPTQIAFNNSSIKLQFVAVLRTPARTDFTILRKCVEMLEGSPEVKASVIKEWILLAKNQYHRDISIQMEQISADFEIPVAESSNSK